MSISSEITSMGENLKKDYQSIANLGADLTNVDKNIENIAELLDGVYDNLPKTEYAEGTEINLGKTIKGKLDYENGVVGIGQSSQDSRQGYNLCEAKLPTMTNSGITITNNNDGTFTINGTNTSTSTTTFRLNQSTQNGIDNLQNYEDGTYTLDLGIQNENLGINLMQNSTWTSFISTGYGIRLRSQTITNATNTFIYIGIKGSAILNNVVIKPMLVKGNYTESTIPSFEQYGASPSPSYEQEIKCVRGTQTVYIKDENNNIIDTKTINLGDIELNAIGNYKDELIYDVDEDRVYKNEKIGKVVLNGSENWVSFTYGTNSWRLSSVVNTNFNANEVLIMSRKFKGIPQANRDDNFAQIYIETSGTQLTIRNTTYTTKAEVQSGMNGEPLFYVLATPTQTEITDPTLISQVKALYNAHSNNGTTIITSNGDLPMIIKVRGLKGE